MARKNAATSLAPTLPRNAVSGGTVTMRQTDPCRGGSRVCGKVSGSRTCAMLAGVVSVTQIRIEAKPGRAGSVRTSGVGPSWIATDLPLSSSIVTILRTEFGASLLKLRSHHHERHEAADAGIGPAVPVAELHDDVAWLHHQLAAVEHEHTLAREQNAIVDGLGFMDGRAEGVLSAAVPYAIGSAPRRMHRHRGWVMRGVVTGGPCRRLNDTQVPARGGGLEMKRQIAVVVISGNRCRRVFVYPNIRHAGAADDCARIDIGRGAIEQNA